MTDLKPDNIFLRQGELARIALLDFGVAHLTQAQAGRALTRTGEVIGTPEYMAPEQIRGERAIGPATDLFALGCVLFEALAGRPPFSGGQVASVLTRILFEEAPDVRTLRPGVPESLAALLGRLLTKDPAARLADAGTLVAELAQLSGQLPEEDVVPEAAAVRPTELRGALKELLCVVVGRPADTGAVTTAPSQGLTLTTDPDALRDALRALGGPADYLPDGSLVVVFRGAPSAVDQAVQAAQAALLVRERWPSARVAVATGRGHHAGLGPVGEAFDRAARLLLLGSTGGGVSAVGEALLDEVTASLIAGRFIMAPGRDGCFALLAARDAADESRPLLGRPTPCVGREGELAQLQGLFAATVEQSEASAVLITGSPGSGKSRLRHEFLRRIAAQGRGERVLTARGAPLRLGVPFALLGQALPGLGAQALPAGQDPAVAQEQLTRTAIELLRSECAAGPLLLVLEDLHWADAASLRILDAALRELVEAPLLILCLCRPEVHERFPALWQHRRRFEIPLRGLPRRACERLIREVLGSPRAAAVEARIIAQAAGNALFLEETMRRARPAFLLRR